MARTARDIDAFLTKLERRFEVLDEETFAIDSGLVGTTIALRVAPPMVVLRVRIGPAPATTEAASFAMFRRLLEHNASDLVYCAYGLEDGLIVLGAALPLENLDLNELEAVLSDIDLALARHVPELRELSKA